MKNILLTTSLLALVSSQAMATLHSKVDEEINHNKLVQKLMARGDYLLVDDLGKKAKDIAKEVQGRNRGVDVVKPLSQLESEAKARISSNLNQVKISNADIYNNKGLSHYKFGENANRAVSVISKTNNLPYPLGVHPV
jgi:hypothetical protein